MQTRPDYAVSVNNALVGFIEVKAPGKGCDPRKFADPHDKEQWGKLKSLPNLVYTDGNGFSLWRDGELAAKIVLLEGDIETVWREAESAGGVARARGGFPELGAATADQRQGACAHSAPASVACCGMRFWRRWRQATAACNI